MDDDNQRVLEFIDSAGATSITEIQTALQFGFVRTRRAVGELVKDKKITYDPDLPDKTVRSLHYTNCNLRMDSFLKTLRKTPHTFESLCDHLGCTPKECRAVIEQAKKEGHNVSQYEGGELYYTMEGTQVRQERMPILPVKDHFVFAACADLHLGSKADMPEEFCDYIETVYKEGAREVLIAGDIFEGIDVYRGQDAQVRLYGLDQQVEYGANVIPQKRGLHYLVMGGNHDVSMINKANADILTRLADLRKDVTHLGNYDVTFPLHGLVAQMHHGARANAYALSYPLQRFIDAIPGGSKPKLLFQGHHHNAFEMFYRNIFAYRPGCFQGETLFTRRMGLHPAPGGYFIEIWTDDAGGVKKAKSEFVAYYFATKVVV